MSGSKICKTRFCDQEVHSRGLCQSHYRKDRRWANKKTFLPDNKSSCLSQLKSLCYRREDCLIPNLEGINLKAMRKRLVEVFHSKETKRLRIRMKPGCDPSCVHPAHTLYKGHENHLKTGRNYGVLVRYLGVG